MSPAQIRQLAVSVQYPTGPVDSALVAKVLNACAELQFAAEARESRPLDVSLALAKLSEIQP